MSESGTGRPRREVPDLLLPAWEAAESGFDPDFDAHWTLRAYDRHWRHLCRTAGALPPLAALNPADIPKLLPGLFIIDIVRAGGGGAEPGAPRFRYRLCGTSQALHDGVDLTGRWVDEAHPPHWAAAIADVYHRLIETRCPHYWSRAMQRFGQEHQWIERVVAPFAEDGRNVDRIVGHVTWV